MLSCVVVEDEPLAQGLLCELIELSGKLRCVDTASTGPEAVTAINKHKPDVVFLDIDLPGYSGLEVLRRVSPPDKIVFTTAYDQHAIAAFELGAIDYLLKPFGAERFGKALSRISATADGNSARTRYQEVSNRDKPLARIHARIGRQIRSVSVSEVVCVTVEGDYLNVATRNSTFLIAISLEELARRLDPQRFFRANRSVLVNLDQVEEITGHEDRRLRMLLTNGTRVIASRTRSKALRAKII